MPAGKLKSKRRSVHLILMNYICRGSAAKKLWLRRQRLLQCGGDELIHARVAAVVSKLVVRRPLRGPLGAVLFRLRIRSRGRDRARVRVDDAIHDDVQLLERSLALRRLGLIGVFRLVIGRQSLVWTRLISRGEEVVG